MPSRAAKALVTMFSGVSDTTAPSVSTFTATTPSTSRDIPITAFTASEVGVYFIVTESSTPPAVDAAGWNLSAPATYTVSTDGTFTLYPWVKDAAGNVSAEFATPRTVTVLALPFTDAFTRADGAIGSIWTGATWTISSNAALNTPTAGANVVGARGEFATWSGDDPTGWSVTGEASGSEINEVGTGEGHGGSGTGSCNFYQAAGPNVGIYAGVLTVGVWYKNALEISLVNSGAVVVLDLAGGMVSPSFSTTGTKVTTGRATNASLYIRSGVNPSDVTIDNVTSQPLTLTSLFATLPSVGVANVTSQVVITADPSGHRAGHIINLDSISSPANFVIAYLDGVGNAKLDKCVGGVYTNVISGAITFGATKNLKVVKNGDSYSLYYGTPGSETQVGTTQTITGMTGTLHGLFGTGDTPRFDTYQLSSP